VGTLLIGMVQESRRLGWIMLGGGVGSVLALVAFAASMPLGSLPIALGLVFLIAGSAAAFMIISMTVLQLEVPDALRGRVMGIHTIGYSLVPLGGLFLGGLADSIGAGWAVITGALVYLIAIAVTARSKPRILNLDGRTLQSTPTAPPGAPKDQPAAAR
jgi:MFS family permease